jgi:DNA polymerase-3 subunit gamma/tau
MSQALYRTYRPQSFKDLVGQNSIRITLENEIEHNRVAHAYLFAGPRGVGKTTTARLLAKAINCVDRKKAEPCNACDFCREISTGRSMDLIEIDAASHTGVDNVRENIIENARFTPQRAKFKIFIIDEVHMLSVSAFNALLKTLEEPPEHVIFILATTEIHRLPETIISRCQRFDFKRVSVDELVKRLQLLGKAEKVNVDEEILLTIARRSEGSVRDAEVLLGQLMALGEKNITEATASLVIPRSNTNLIFELFGYLVHNDAPSAVVIINKLVDEGVNLQDFTRDLIEFIRKILLTKLGSTLGESENMVLDKKDKETLRKQLELVTVSQLTRMIEIFSAKSREFKYSPIIQLPLELAVLEIVEDYNVPEVNVVKSTPPVIKPPSESTKGDETARKPAKIPPATKTNTGGKLEIAQVRVAWQKIIKQLQKLNHSLALSLKVGCPLSIESNCLNIGFRYNFHADRFKDRKIKSAVEETMAKVLGVGVVVKATIVSQEEFEKNTVESISEPTESNSTLNNVLQTFGGEVVPEK